jgi:ELWxxDGT repeat protein
VLADKLGFLVHDSDQGSLDLWSWRPSAPAASRVASFGRNTIFDQPAWSWQAIGRRLYFSANSSEFGAELFRSNLTPTSTALVRDLKPLGSGLGSEPRNLMRLGAGGLFFADPDSAFPAALWKTDGTAPGTELVAEEVEHPSTHSLPSAELGSQVLYAVGRALWRSDGTASGTYSLRLEESGAELIEGRYPVAAGSKVYFPAWTPASGWEPWVTDGTVAGTRQLADLEPGSGGSQIGGFVPLEGKALFVAKTGRDGGELWISDGSTGGTHIVKDLTPEPDLGTAPRSLVAQ